MRQAVMVVGVKDSVVLRAFTSAAPFTDLNNKVYMFQCRAYLYFRHS